MAWFIEVPMEIWGLLLLPSVLLAAVAALQRTYIWTVMLCFSLAVLTAAATESYYTIFVMKRFDEKFRYAPGEAFELALFGYAVLGILGGIYSTLPNVDLPNALFWILVVVIPITAARLTIRRIGAENADSFPLLEIKFK